MTQVPTGMRVCPTRADATPALFAHTVTLAMCQGRQREHYHKCFTCVHSNARAPAMPALPPRVNGSTGAERVNGSNGTHEPLQELPTAKRTPRPRTVLIPRAAAG